MCDKTTLTDDALRLFGDTLWRDRDLGALVWYLLANADERGVVIFTQRKLAATLGVSVRKLRDMLDNCFANCFAERFKEGDSEQFLKHLTIVRINVFQRYAERSVKRSKKCSEKRVGTDLGDGCELVAAEVVSKDEIDFDALLDYFNDMVSGTAIPTLRVMTDRRRRAVKARLKETDKQTIMKVIEKAVGSYFLNGTETKWRCSFDWIFTPSNFNKILEGNYDNRDSRSFGHASGGGKRGDRTPASLAAAILERVGAGKAQ